MYGLSPDDFEVDGSLSSVATSKSFIKIFKALFKTFFY